VLPLARAAYVFTRTGDDVLITHPGGTVLLRSDVESTQFADTTLSFAEVLAATGSLLTGTDSDDTLSGTTGNDTLRGLDGSDRLSGQAGNDSLDGGLGDYDWLSGGPGNDTVDGGERTTVAGGFNVDIVRYDSSEGPLVLNLAAGTATQDGFSDQLSRINAVFAGGGADSLRGLDGPAALRGETLRGGAGNDTLDGGTGVDVAEFRGNRADYTLTRVNATTWTVRDNNPDAATGGNEGTDTLIGIERIVFADEMLAFGSRAEDIAKVGMALWSMPILFSAGLFTRGYSFYDNGGYSFKDMSRVALNFWTQLSDAQLAAQLSTNTNGFKSAEQFLALMQAAGGGLEGRAAAVRDAATAPVLDQFLTTSGVRDTGIVAVNFLENFGQLFELLPS
jgi:hypothetical protein